jgi:hypothetical protein
MRLEDRVNGYNSMTSSGRSRDLLACCIVPGEKVSMIFTLILTFFKMSSIKKILTILRWGLYLFLGDTGEFNPRV